MGLFKRWRARRAAKKQLKEEQKLKETKVQKETTEEVKDETKVEKVETQKTAPQKETEAKTKQPEKEEKPAVLKTEEKSAEPTTKEKDTKESFRYHVAQNKDKKSAYFKQWRVRRSGSTKTIKYFDTQKEAIEYAEELAKKNDTSVVIHKVDGSIRKQNY